MRISTRWKYFLTNVWKKKKQCAIVERALSVRHGGALEQSPESKCRTCRLHKTGRPIIARICSSIENNKIWWLGDNTIFIQIFKCWRIWKSFGISLMPTQHPPESCCQSNLKLTWNFANIKKKSFPPSAVWCKFCCPKNGSKKWIYADQWSSNVFTK